MGHQSYVLLCSKITSFPPSEGEFSEKFGIFSKMKIFQNPSCYILEKINENYDNFFLAIMMHWRFMGHQSYVVNDQFSAFKGVSEITFGSICSRSLCYSISVLKVDIIGSGLTFFDYQLLYQYIYQANKFSVV